MDILQMMLVERLRQGELSIVLNEEAVKGLECGCMAALARIRAVLADDSLEDPECFERIERIVCELEALGIDCGPRHDFG